MSEPHTDAERDLHDFYKFPVGEETTAAAFDAWWEDPATPSLLADGWTEYFLAFKAGVEWAGARTPTLPAGAAPYDDMTDFEDATHVIREWVQGDPVITTALTRELLYWASWAAGDRPPAEREGTK